MKAKKMNVNDFIEESLKISSYDKKKKKTITSVLSS